MASVYKQPCDEGVIRARPADAPCAERQRKWVLAATILGYVPQRPATVKWSVVVRRGGSIFDGLPSARSTAALSILRAVHTPAETRTMKAFSITLFPLMWPIGPVAAIYTRSRFVMVVNT